MEQSEELYNQLAYYTLAHKDPAFIHQHIVDAFAAQTADQHTKPIKLSFALIGLYLYLEKDFTGKEVQYAHMRFAKKRKQWPTFGLPDKRGDITIADVLHVPEGNERDAMIKTWCQSVWDAYHDVHKEVADLVNEVENQ